LLPVVVVAAAAISNIAQISFLQTLAAKKRNTHQEKGKKKPKTCYCCALCNYTTEMMMQKKDKDDDDDEEEDEQEGERVGGRWGENMVQESSGSGHTRNQRGEWTDAKPRRHDGWMDG
jgi:hypothetical protein